MPQIVSSSQSVKDKDEWTDAAEWAGTQPIYVIRVRAKPGIDPIRALRSALKALGRRFGLQALEVREERKS